jgi:hypothetical protein
MTQKKIEIRLSTKDKKAYDELRAIRSQLFELSIKAGQIRSACPVASALARETEEQLDAIRNNLFGFYHGLKLEEQPN